MVEVVGSAQDDGARLRQGLRKIIERVKLGLMMEGSLGQAGHSTQEVKGGGEVGWWEGRGGSSSGATR